MLELPDSEPTSASLSYREAYLRVEPELSSLDKSKLAHINVEIPDAVYSVLRALPELRKLRQRMIDLFTDFDLEQFDKLELYAKATLHGHIMLETSSRPAEPLPALLAACTKLRDMLRRDAQALLGRGLLQAHQLELVSGKRSARAVCTELMSLHALLDQNWERIEGKTAVTRADLTEAETLGTRLLYASAQKGQARAEAIAEAALLRQRVYTLFFRAYDRARQALTYVRWSERDRDKILPSLFRGRTAGPRKPRVAPAVPPFERVTATVSAPSSFSDSPMLALLGENPD